MPRKDGLETRDRAWTQPGAYIESLARRRTFRRKRGEKPRTQPESPRVLLSTAPFLILLCLMAVVTVGIFVLAFPGSQPQPKPKQVAAKQQGVAERGWLQEAEKEFH
jgi:hypothetical protein